MKKTLTFIPLGIGISAAIIYVFNVIQFRVINNSATLLQILSNLKIYLYIAIIGFVLYFLIKILTTLGDRKSEKVVSGDEKESDFSDEYERFEIPTTNEIRNLKQDDYVPNYDYVPMYHEEKKGNYLASEIKKEEVITTDNTSYENTNRVENNDSLPLNLNKYCYNCGEKINYTDKYCSKCGALLKANRKNTNPCLKNVINVLEIVILILIIYFSLNMLFEYKESKDPNFTSPFKVSMTK